MKPDMKVDILKILTVTESPIAHITCSAMAGEAAYGINAHCIILVTVMGAHCTFICVICNWVDMNPYSLYDVR